MQFKSVSDAYESIFNVPFFIEYGYYDFTTKELNSKKDEINKIGSDEFSRFLKNSLVKDTLSFDDFSGKSDSFYYRFTNLNDLSNLFRFNNLDIFFDSDKEVPTEPIYFNIPKIGFTRRLYKMPNIYSYIKLARFLSKNKTIFIEEFLSNKQSISKFFNEFDFNYMFTRKIEKSLTYGGNKILHIDLSNFFHTVYTHSIPWVINGKEESKKNKNSGFANELDKLIRHCQYDETHGVPVGNLITRIIMEYYMCKIDEIMSEKGFKYSRYVDDIKFSYTNESDKELFLMEFNKICRKFALIINDNKVKEESFPFEIKNDKNSIFSFFNNMEDNIDSKKWINSITDFIDICVSEENKGNKGSIKCIFPVIIFALKANKMNKDSVNDIFFNYDKRTNFNVFEQLIDVSLKDSRLTNNFIRFSEELITCGFKKRCLKKIVKNYFISNKDEFRSKLEYYRNNIWNQEMYQILLYCVVFCVYDLVPIKDIKIIMSDFDTDDFSLCLLSIIWLNKRKTPNRNFSILSKFDEILMRSHKIYNDGSPDQGIGRMSEQKWLFRYFIYELINENKISKSDLRNYFTKSNKKRQKKVKL